HRRSLCARPRRNRLGQASAVTYHTSPIMVYSHIKGTEHAGRPQRSSRCCPMVRESSEVRGTLDTRYSAIRKPESRVPAFRRACCVQKETPSPPSPPSWWWGGDGCA